LPPNGRYEPSLTKTQLFEAGKGGYATYRIPGIVVTTVGTVLAYCEARKSVRGDWGAIDILMRRSTDGGFVWEEPKKVGATSKETPKNAAALRQRLAHPNEETNNNPVAIVDHETKAVHFLFCAEYARCYHARSDDDGVTFGPPVDITNAFDAYRPDYDWKVLATGPGHGIQLRGGRLLVPVWLSTGTGRHAHRPSVVSVIYSDDHGATWQRGDIVVRHSARVPNPSETVAAQLSDGRVMLNIRNESPRHRRLVSFSDDGATGWSRPQLDDALFEPVCSGSIARLTRRPDHAQDRLVFANPDSRQNPAGPNAWGAWPRENLTVRLSYDEGQTWPVAKVLEPGISGYSDLAAGPDGTIYCTYEDGGIGGEMYSTACLTLARFNLEWLAEGVDSLAA
jgi:sialidase-1